MTSDDQNNHNTKISQSTPVTVPLEKLEEAYRIIDAMRQVMDGEVQEAMGTCYMTDGYETLAAACGLLGEMIGMDGFLMRAVQEAPTRQAFRDCYEKADAIMRNAKPETDAGAIAMNLRACAVSGLNETYGPNQSAQDALGRILYMSGYAMDLIARCKELGPEAFRDMYVDPGGDTLYAHLELFENTFRMLQPRYDPDKNKEDAE